jgi:Tfp pilus assembly protein PilX
MGSMMRWRFHRRAGNRGMALPVVLVMASMMLVTSSAWFEASLLEARNASLIADDLQAFHAADAALLLCTRALMSGTVPMPALPAQAGEPDGWRRQLTFDTQAVALLASWPGSVKPPQCLFESWRLVSRPAARAFVVTARGFGASERTQSWLQAHLVFEGAHVERHWRRIVARPF